MNIIGEAMAHIGKKAVVVGAGMSGLLAARALADHFDEATILERDALPGSPMFLVKALAPNRHALDTDDEVAVARPDDSDAKICAP